MILLLSNAEREREREGSEECAASAQQFANVRLTNWCCLEENISRSARVYALQLGFFPFGLGSAASFSGFLLLAHVIYLLNTPIMAALELNNGMVYGRNSLLSRVNLKRKINGFMIFCIT